MSQETPGSTGSGKDNSTKTYATTEGKLRNPPIYYLFVSAHTTTYHTHKQTDSHKQADSHNQPHTRTYS